MNNTMKESETKSMKVGYSTTLEIEVIKRLNTLLMSSEKAGSAAKGIIVGVSKYESMLAAIGTREGFRDILQTLEPLRDAMALAKQTIRKDQGLTMTPEMEDDMCEIIVWHAEQCAAAMAGIYFKGERVLRMIKKQDRLVAKMRRMQQGAASSSTSGSILSASSRSRSSSICSTLSLSSSDGYHSSGGIGEGGVFYPCVEPDSTAAEEIVVARQPLTAAGLLVARLPGSAAAVSRWCSRVVGACISRVRCWI